METMAIMAVEATEEDMEVAKTPTMTTMGIMVEEVTVTDSHKGKIQIAWSLAAQYAELWPVAVACATC